MTSSGGQITLGELPSSVASVSAAYAEALIEGIEVPAPTGNEATDTENLRAAWTLQQAKGAGTPIQLQVGVYKVDTTAGVIFPQGAGAPVPLRGRAVGIEGTSTVAAGTKILRGKGTNPIWTGKGTGNGGTSERCVPMASNIEFNGGNLEGSVVVLERTVDNDLHNVRFINAKGRVLRLKQSYNGRHPHCFFTNGGKEPTLLTGTWANGATELTAVGAIPPEVDNLPVYGPGIPSGTVIVSVAGQKIKISQATTAEAATEQSLTIEAIPMVSIEGYPGVGSLGASAINHFVDCEWEGAAGPWLELSGSTDGQSAPCNGTFISGGKSESQVVTNHSPGLLERYAMWTEIGTFSLNPGGSVTTGTGTIEAGSLETLTLTEANANVKVGQQVSGLGAPAHYTVKATGTAGSKILQIQGTLPKAGVGATSEQSGTTISGPAVGARARTPQSGAVKPGNKIAKINSATEVELEEALTETIAGQEVVFGGTFVSNVVGAVVTLDAPSTGAHVAQTYIFGGVRARIIDKPSGGYALGDLILSGVRFQHTGAPDFYINQGSGIISAAALKFTSSAPQPPSAYWRIGSGVAADTAKLPVKGAHCQYPLQLFFDERTILPSAAAHRTINLKPEGFTVNNAATAAVVIGKKLGWQAPKAGGNTSRLLFTFTIPEDIAPGAWLYIKGAWATPGTAGEAHFALGAILTPQGSASANIATTEFEEQNSIKAKANATANSVTQFELKSKATIGGNKLLPGSVLHLAVMRVAGSEDTLEEVLNFFAIDLCYQRA